MANNPPKGGPRGRGNYQKPKNLTATMVRMFAYLTRRPLLLTVAVLCVIAAALADEKIQRQMAGMKLVKTIVVKNRIINLILKREN
jgi:hypothetical protein